MKNLNKKIHYFWFGGGKKPELVSKCIKSWKKYAPDWEIVEWNDRNYNPSEKFFQDAKKKKLYAMMSDYGRFDVLLTYGGLYLDTDFELIKPLSESLKENFSALITGKETQHGLAAAFIYANEPNLQAISDARYLMTKKYNAEKHFFVINDIFTPLLTSQKYKDVNILPQNYLYPYNPFDPDRKNLQLMFQDITDETFAIHHYSHSWRMPLLTRIRKKLRLILR